MIQNSRRLLTIAFISSVSESVIKIKLTEQHAKTGTNFFDTKIGHLRKRYHVC